MATGGFKLNKFSWTGTGSDTWPGETGTVTEEQRLVRVLSGIAEAICDDSSGWIMDTNYHADVNDYTPCMDMQNYEYINSRSVIKGYNKISFLKRSDGGLYLAIGITTGIAKLRDTDCVFKPVYTNYSDIYSYNNGITGLYFSLSKNGQWESDSDYGIILGDGDTRWCSFGRSDAYAAYGNEHYNASNNVSQNSANIIYSYYFLTKGNQIAIFEKCSSWGPNKIKCIIGGDLIGTFAHPTLDTKSLCCFSLSENNVREPSTSDSDRGECTEPITNISSSYYINQESSYFCRIYNNASNSQIQKANGNIIYSYKNKTGIGLSVSNPIQLSLTISNSSDNGSRWCPIQVYVQSDDPVTNGIISNDGFKGYLDTDFIRFVRIGAYSLGSVFDNGNFIYIGSGLILGWDSSITESLF